MFNLVKVLELTMNDGKCMITGHQTGLKTGAFEDHADYISFEKSFRRTN